MTSTGGDDTKGRSAKTGTVPAFPATQALYERDLASLRAQLATETFEAAWARGRTMTLEETVAESLAQDV
jgi:hypothetical protein